MMHAIKSEIALFGSSGKQGTCFTDCVLTCTCTCIMMSGEADALNAHIFFLELVETVLEGIGRWCIHNVFWKSIPVCHHSLVEECLLHLTPLYSVLSSHCAMCCQQL